MKNNITKNSPFTKIQAFKAALWVSLTVNVILIMGMVYDDSIDLVSVLKEDGIGYMLFFLLQFACNLFLFFVLFLFCFLLTKKKPESKRTALKAILGTIVICLFLSPPLSQLQLYLFEGGDDGSIAQFTLFSLVKDMIAGFVVILITETMQQSYKREQTNIANQQLISENIKVKYEALKNQLDPHFLFNSLNTLDGLIGLDEEKAHEYVDNLSSVFRYTLHSKNMVKLEDEIEFVNAYVSLLKIRFGKSMRVEYYIDNKFRSYAIMPISIQLLVENAVKHNIIHGKNPLVITIETDNDGYLIVSNVINLRPEKSIGRVGLVNLSERYKLLFRKEIEIKNINGVFSVKIPLINETDKTISL
ncbi:sensor histidine kinase [Parabacteroides timonensis]|uniref:sensor histidine kinase n=1 Tax=Parabacteroides timonensis TaxID=1871013 RepID=UPI00094E5E98|nr:histidine kinase [Parabacteroides timonensis]